jgi:nitrite reductase/ring-hydroxylating ferredoxin subunit
MHNPRLMKFLSLAVFFICLAACGKKKDTLEGGLVNATLYLSDPSYFALNAINGWVYYTGPESGHRGIIVFRRTQDEFTAFDRICTYDPGEECATVAVEQSGLTAVDSCCGSRFQITDGAVVNGPAQQPLIPYRTSFDGQAVHVFN